MIRVGVAEPTAGRCTPVEAGSDTVAFMTPAFYCEYGGAQMRSSARHFAKAIALFRSFFHPFV